MQVLAGVRVLEVAAWAFVPSAGAVLAEWGAEVIKVEHPKTGDPQRALIGSGFLPAGSVDYMVELPNRGKKSLALDLKQDAGRELLYRMAATSDVFLTNWLPGARRRARIDVEHIRAHNPSIIYARGSGNGQRGPEAERGGFDSSTYWARGGIAYALSPPELEHPVRQRSAFGDIMGGLTIAGAISAALYRREHTGEPSIVDLSLLSLALYNLSVDITSAGVFDRDEVFRYDNDALANPTVGIYRTSDGRHVNLTMLESDRYWADLCQRLGHPELVDDERFSSHARRSENRRECTGALRRIFEERTLAEWKERLAGSTGVWGPLATPREVHDDPQVVANGYLADVATREGRHIRMPTSPVQFDETPVTPRGAPAIGEDTDELLDGLGLSSEEIAEHRSAGVIR